MKTRRPGREPQRLQASNRSLTGSRGETLRTHSHKSQASHTVWQTACKQNQDETCFHLKRTLAPDLILSSLPEKKMLWIRKAGVVQSEQREWQPGRFAQNECCWTNSAADVVCVSGDEISRQNQIQSCQIGWTLRNTASDVVFTALSHLLYVR